MLSCELKEPRITTNTIYMIKLPQSSINIAILPQSFIYVIGLPKMLFIVTAVEWEYLSETTNENLNAISHWKFQNLKNSKNLD